MSKLYNDGALDYSVFFNPIINFPLDNRTVVNTYESLFDVATWQGSSGGPAMLYSGIPVFVCEPVENTSYDGKDKELKKESGLYVLVRSQGIVFNDDVPSILAGYKYLYDPNATEDQEPFGTIGSVSDPFVPGISNICGWTKVLSFPDLKFPPPDPDGDKQYVLDIHSDGTWEWTDLTEYFPRPDAPNTVLTCTDIANGEYILQWLPVSGGTMNVPEDSGRWVLHTFGNGDWEWVAEGTSNSALNIKHFADVIDPGPGDNEGRYIPDMSDSQLAVKRILSNSGEVIAADITSESDPDEDTQSTGADRPFRLMLNLEKFPITVVNGGNADPDVDVCEFYIEYRIGDYYGELVKNVHAYSIPVGDPVPALPSVGSTLTEGGVQYTVIGSEAGWPSVASVNCTGYVYVEAIPEWIPVGYYAMVPFAAGTTQLDNFPSITDNTFNTDQDHQAGRYLLLETAPDGTDSSSAPSGSKYLYLNAPVLSAASSTVNGCGILKFVDEGEGDFTPEPAVIYYWRTGTSSEWVPISNTSVPSITLTELEERSGEYKTTMEYNGNAVTNLAIRIKVTKPQ